MPSLQTRPVVITGCSGFVGANLALAVSQRGARVIGVDSPASSDWRIRDMRGVELVQLDLRQQAEVAAFIQSVQPLAIYNCAAYGAYSVQADPERIFDVNLLAVRHLLEAVRGLAGFQAFVQAGSSSEYGFNCRAPREDAATQPDSDYAVSKVAATQLVRMYAQKHGVPGFVLRLYSVYGPYEDFSRLVPKLLGHAQEGRFPALVNPNISRDFVYVGDVVRAFETVLSEAHRLTPGEVFNVGSGVRTTLGELVQLVRELFEIAAEPAWGSMPNRAWDHPDWFADPSKAARVIDWRCRVPLRAGLSAYAGWLKEHPALVDEGRRRTALEPPR